MAPSSSSAEGGAAATVALSVLPKRLGGLAVTALGTQEQQEANNGRGVRLVPGELYDMSVRLYDAFGAPIDTGRACPYGCTMHSAQTRRRIKFCRFRSRNNQAPERAHEDIERAWACCHL